MSSTTKKTAVSVHGVDRKFHIFCFAQWMELKWYFRKLMANGSLFLGIDSSQERNPPELSGTHTLDEKSIPASKTEVS
jgi:hypothetical protein